MNEEKILALDGIGAGLTLYMLRRRPQCVRQRDSIRTGVIFTRVLMETRNKARFLAVVLRYDENPIMMMMQIKHIEMLSSPKTVQISLSLRDCQTKCQAPHPSVRSCKTLPKDEELDILFGNRVATGKFARSSAMIASQYALSASSYLSTTETLHSSLLLTIDSSDLSVTGVRTSTLVNPLLFFRVLKIPYFLFSSAR